VAWWASATVSERRNVFRGPRKARARRERGSIHEGMNCQIDRHSPFGVLGDVHGDGGDLELRLLLTIDPVFDVVDGVRADVQRAALGHDRRGCGGRRGKKGQIGVCWGRVGRRGRDRALRGLGAREKARDAHPNRPRRRPRRPAGRGPLRYQRCCSYSEALRCRQKCDNRPRRQAGPFHKNSSQSADATRASRRVRGAGWRPYPPTPRIKCA